MGRNKKNQETMKAIYTTILLILLSQSLCESVRFSTSENAAISHHASEHIMEHPKESLAAASRQLEERWNYRGPLEHAPIDHPKENLADASRQLEERWNYRGPLEHAPIDHPKENLADASRQLEENLTQTAEMLKAHADLTGPKQKRMLHASAAREINLGNGRSGKRELEVVDRETIASGSALKERKLELATKEASDFELENDTYGTHSLKREMAKRQLEEADNIVSYSGLYDQTYSKRNLEAAAPVTYEKKDYDLNGSIPKQESNKRNLVSNLAE